jgi:hypothetical protein
MLRHIYKVLAGGNKKVFRYIVMWTAWSLQNPGKPAEVALVFRGGRGTGKGLYARAMKQAFGQHGLQISSAEHLTGRFNLHLMDCALLFADEAFWPGHKATEGSLKRMITEPTLFVEPKNINAFEVENNLHIIMAANADWVVPAGLDERRFAFCDVSERYKQSKEYFDPLYAEIEAGGIAAMMDDLLAMDLNSWHPREAVPQTAALDDQKMRTLSPEDQFWLILLESGELPEEFIQVVRDEPEKYERRASSSSIFKYAREKVPRLKNHSDHNLGRVLKSHGCNKERDIRVNGSRTWQFPPLAEARAAWSSKNPTTWDEKPEWTHINTAF